MNNEPIYSSARKHGVDTELLWLATVLEGAVRVETVANYIEKIEAGLKQSDHPRLSKLEQSMLSEGSLKHSRDPTKDVAKFFQRFIASLKSWFRVLVNRNDITVQGVPIQLRDGATQEQRLLRGFVFYLKDMVTMTSSDLFDDAAFQTYLAVGRTLVDNSKDVVALTGLGSSLGTCLDIFNADWQLTTGCNMEIIWTALNPSIPSSGTRIEWLLKAEEIAERFDQMVWRSTGSLRYLAKLRQTLILNLKSGLDEDLGGLNESDRAISEEEQNLGAQGTALHPHFQEVFEAMQQHICLHRLNIGVNDESMLALVARRSSKDLVSRHKESPNLLTDLRDFTGITNEHVALAACRGVFPIMALRSLYDVPNVSLGSMKMLVQEMDFLGFQIARTAQHIASNSYALFHARLGEIQSQVYLAHSQLLESKSLSSVLAFLRKLPVQDSVASTPRLIALSTRRSATIDHQFRQVIDRYLNPSLEFLNSACTPGSPSLPRTSTAWIMFFIGSILLYLPDKPFDPAMRSRVDAQRWQQRKAELEAKLEALQTYEFQISGNRINFRYSLVKAELEELGDEPGHQDVPRPTISKLSRIQEDFTDVLVIVRRCQKFSTVSSLEDLEQSSELDTLRQSIAQVHSRLTEHFGIHENRMYEDMIKPVIGFLEGLDVGLSLALIAMLNGSVLRSFPLATTALPMTDALFGVNITSLSNIIRDGQSSKQAKIISSELSILKHLVLQKQVLEEVTGDVRLRIAGSFRTIYELWKHQLGLDREKHAMKSSLYHYQGSHDDGILEDEAEFQELFPDYEFASQGTETADVKIPDLQDLARTLADVQKELVAGSKDCSDAILDTVSSITKDFAMTQYVSKYYCSGISEGSLLASVLLELDSSSRRLLNQAERGKTSFYHDQNLEEAQKLVDLVHRSQAKFKSLKDSWPEHTTINDVLRTTEELLCFRHTEPLAKLIGKCEKLHGQVYEWQTVASREYSAINIYNELTETIIRWRSLELDSWRRLLDLEDERCIQEAKSWWFVAYEVIIGIDINGLEAASTHSENLLAELQRFLVDTSCGHYSARLDLIRDFSQYASFIATSFPVMGVINHALNSFIQYHQRFEEHVKCAIAKGREDLMKKLKEIIKLAGWKDTNIAALRESAKRSHHKLFKIVRKYRALLAQPVKLVLDQSLEKPITDSRISHLRRISLSELSLSDANDYCKGYRRWSELSIRFKEPSMTTSKMSSYAHYPASKLDLELYLESFSHNLIDTIRVLQKETPTTLTDDNKNTVKHLMVRKRKVFSDTLKALREMGFKSNLDAETLRKQSSLHAVLNNAPVNVKLQAAERSLFAAIDNILDARDMSRKHSTDLTPGEVAKSGAYLESILQTLLKQRKALVSFLSSRANFMTACDQLSNVWGARIVPGSENNEHKASRSLMQRIRWIQPMIGALHTLLGKHESLGKIDSSVVRDRLATWKKHFALLDEELRSLPRLPIGLSSSDEKQACQNSQLALTNLIIDIEAWMAQFPEIKFALEHLVPWLSIDKQVDRIFIDNDNVTLPKSIKQTDMDSFEIDTTQILDAAFVGIQQLSAAVKQLPESDEDKRWLCQNDSSLHQILDSLNLPSLTARIDCILLSLSGLAGDQVQMASAFCALIVPVMQQYGQIFEQYLDRYYKFHASLCWTAQVLSSSLKQILTNGFCNPQAKSGEQTKSDKLEEGTGLGDGEGAEDISNDVQDDEDLAELAQEEHTEKNKNETDEDNAVDMTEDDFNGELDESGEERDDDSDGEDGEIDEEIGEIDGLDPSAVDEKLWDSKDDESTTKDKEGNKSSGKKQEDVTAQNEAQEAPVDADEAEAEEGAQEDEQVVQGEAENLDPYVEEGQTLDLPEEMDIDDEDDPDALQENYNVDDSSDISEDKAEDHAMENSEDVDMDDQPKSTQEQEKDIGDDGDDMETEQAGSPVDTNAGESEDEDEDQNLLTDPTRDFDNAEEAVSSDVKGIGGQNEQDNTQDDVEGQGAQSSNGKQNEMLEDTIEHAAGERGERNQATENVASTEREEGTIDEPELRPFKKLGDALDRWHRRNQEILNPSTQEQDRGFNPADKNTDMREFEHLPDDDVVADAQALGAADEEQAQALDRREFDAELDDRPDEVIQDPEFIDNQDEQMEDSDNKHSLSDVENDDTINGATIGPRPKQGPSSPKGMELDPEDELNELDNELSTVNLQSDSHADKLPEETAYVLWNRYETSTRDLSLVLTEQLRLILAPTLATRMRGDFISGKRLNIKRIMPYIASGYRNRKIWMRRSVPSKRNYQIMLSVDDSKSMGEGGSGDLAFESLALISRSLSMLEVGEICILGFGESVRVAHPFDQPFSSEAGVKVFQQFTFSQKKTNVRKLVAESLEIFREARAKQINSSADLWQLQLIISDGVCDSHDHIRRLVRQAQEERVMIVFVIVDAMKEQSILRLNQAFFDADNFGKPRPYMDTFPFAYYLIVSDIKELPGVLAAVLRQWFSEIVEV